jgi:rRNA processing protein Gar1
MVSRVRHNRVKAQNAKPCTTNAEEIDIEIDSDEEIPARGPGATIDNAQDVHVIAKALGGGVGGVEGVQPRVQAVAQAAAKPPPPPSNGQANAPSESSSSDSSSSEDSEDEVVMDVSSYNDMKNLVDEMMGRGGNTHGQNGKAGNNNNNNNGSATHHPQAYQELFDTSESSLDALRASLSSLTVSPSEELCEAGTVITCLEGTVVVQASLPAADACLAEGSILVTGSRQVLGPIEDIFGPVEAPMYVLMDPAKLYGEVSEESEGTGAVRVQVGDTVWYVGSLATRIVEMERLKEVGMGEEVEIAGAEEDDDDDDKADKADEEEDGDGDGDGDGEDGEEDATVARPAAAPAPPVAPRPAQPPRTIAEWQAQQAAAGGPSAKPAAFKPVAFSRAFMK